MNNTIQQPPRSKAEIDHDYTQCAMKVGDLEFRVKRITQQIKDFYLKMEDLEQEAKASAAAQVKTDEPS